VGGCVDVRPTQCYGGKGRVKNESWIGIQRGKTGIQRCLRKRTVGSDIRKRSAEGFAKERRKIKKNF